MYNYDCNGCGGRQNGFEDRQIGFVDRRNGCGDCRKGFDGIQKDVETVIAGIKECREGLDDIRCGRTEQGEKECRDGVNICEAGLHEIYECLKHAPYGYNCGCAKLVQKGICEVHKGDLLVLDGAYYVGQCQICQGEKEIAAGICTQEKGVNDIIRGLRDISRHDECRPCC